LHVIGLIVVVTVEVIFDGTAVARDYGILGSVDGYAIQPRVESTVTAKLRQRPISLDEGFLGDVLGLGWVAYVAHDQLDEFVLVLEHQRIECPLVAALHAAYQAQITCIGAHPLLPDGG